MELIEKLKKQLSEEYGIHSDQELMDAIAHQKPIDILQQLIAATGITMIEFISGLILNVWLGLNMWDYSNMPGNILGQICPQFTLLWFFLSAFGIFLDDLIRWLLFGEEKPHYHLFRKRKGDK